MALIRQPAVGWLALIAGVIGAALLHGGNSAAPPIYDGILLPKAYRYVSPPPNLRSSNEPPLPGEASFPLQNGKVTGGGVQTGDGQLLAFFGVDALPVSPGTQSVRVRLEPVTDPPPPPAGMTIRGNVYRISAIGQPSGTVLTMTSAAYHITMQFPMGPFQDIQLYDGTSWMALSARRVGTVEYAGANLTRFGLVAATAPEGARGDSIFTVLARIVEGYGLLAFIVVFGIIAVVHELRRRRKRS